MAEVFNFKAINRKLNRQEQKAEFEAKNPKVEQSAYDALSGGMFGIGSLPSTTNGTSGSTVSPFGDRALEDFEAGGFIRWNGTGWVKVSTSEDNMKPPLKSMAHPE